AVDLQVEAPGTGFETAAEVGVIARNIEPPGKRAGDAFVANRERHRCINPQGGVADVEPGGSGEAEAAHAVDVAGDGKSAAETGHAQPHHRRPDVDVHEVARDLHAERAVHPHQ